MAEDYAPYPDDFPERAQAKVEAAKIRAYIAFDDAKDLLSVEVRAQYLKSLTKKLQGLGGEQVREQLDEEKEKVFQLLIDCVVSVFAVFAKEACELGRRGTWTVVQLREEVLTYLKRLAREIYVEKGYDTKGVRLPPIVNQTAGGRFYEFADDTERTLKSRQEWKRYEQDRLAVAEQRSKDHEAAEVAVKPERRGYRTEVKAWMKHIGLTSQKAAAKRLGVSLDVLKSIMSDKGRARYSSETLKDVLAKILPKTNGD